MKFSISLLVLVGVLLTPESALSKQSFDSWKKSYAKRAAKRGLPYNFVMGQLKNSKFDQSVVDKDKKQVILSKKKDYTVFIKKWLRENPSRIEKGKELLKKHHTLLTQIERKYGVEKEIIVSLWGVETFYGAITGSYDLVDSLATLAYDGRRRKFFETQLNAALRLIKNGHVKRETLKGSWAGATGQCQFMPSNINIYAQDWNKDGKKDIWNTQSDVFASIAYFLKRVGWKKGKSIGSLALNTKNKTLNKTRYRSKSEYNRLGFRNLDGTKIKKGAWLRRRSSPIPMKNSPVVLRGSNYKPLLKWNRSSLFAAFNILMVDGFKK